jgi:hypothetical protein
MRWFYFALFMSVATAAGAGGYLYRQSDRLDEFCAKLPLGASVVEVRKSAQRQGFESSMEPYTQMRIKPKHWHLAPPSCRVFFNRDRTVEYRLLQDT